MKPHLSVVIPAFNEAKRILPTLERLTSYLSTQEYTYEIIIVNDGSTDQTAEIVAGANVRYLKIVHLQTNTGKGAAVRLGMLSAVGSVRLYMDADSSTDIEEVEKLLPFVVEGYEIVIGSRRATGATIQVPQNLIREFLGATYRALLGYVIPNQFIDTQNGFKIFSEQAATAIFSNLQTDGWSFDIEALLLGIKQSFKIKEVPIIWINHPQSHMTLWGMFRMPIDLLRIRSRFL